jgi:hypothetical protein
MQRPSELQKRRLADLLRAVIERCDALLGNKGKPVNPPLTTLLTETAWLSKSLPEIGILCAEFRLLKASERLREFRDELDQWFIDTFLPIMARDKTPEEIEALHERYGPFPIPPGDAETYEERKSFLRTVAIGKIVELNEYVRLLLKTVDGDVNVNNKTRQHGHNGNGEAITTNKETLRKHRRGRPSDTDHAQDKRIFEARKSGFHKTNADIAKEFGLPLADVNLAIDRERKRRARSKSASDI